MSDRETNTGRGAIWTEQPALPSGLLLQHQETLVVPRRGRGGESTIDIGTLKTPGGTVGLLVAYRSAPTPHEALKVKALLAGVAEQLRLRGRTAPLLPVLAADVASQSVVELCTREGIGVLDRSGTVVLHQGPLFIHVVGAAGARRDKRVSLFSGRARRVVRTLLVHPGQRFPVQVIADAAGVSFAFAYRVLGRLESEGYVERPSPRGGYATRDAAALLRAWATSPEGASASIARFYAPNTRPEALARAAAKASEAGVRVHFTLASGLRPEEVIVAGLPHGAYLSGDLRVFGEALDLEDTTPHNFWVFRGDPRADLGAGGVEEGARELDVGPGVSLAQLAVDVASVPARGLDAMERVVNVFTRQLPLGVGVA